MQQVSGDTWVPGDTPQVWPGEGILKAMESVKVCVLDGDPHSLPCPSLGLRTRHTDFYSPGRRMEDASWGILISKDKTSVDTDIWGSPSEMAGLDLMISQRTSS